MLSFVLFVLTCCSALFFCSSKVYICDFLTYLKCYKSYLGLSNMKYVNDERLNLNVCVGVNDDDSYDNNFMLVLTFTASTISGHSDHGI